MEEPINDSKETSSYKRKYEQCKAVVLKWETAFTREKGKQPTKNDFRLAPTPVQVAYLTYLEIKRLLLKIGKGTRDAGNHSDVSEVRKKKTVESPGRIFPRRNFSSKGCVEEYDPALEKLLRNQSLMDGVTPLPSTPMKSLISPRMQAILPNLKFTYRTPSKRNSKLDDDAPFGKLSSKLFVKEAEELSKTFSRPRGKSGTKTVETATDKESADFLNEMDSILVDVRNTVETYDRREDFPEETEMDLVIDLGLSFGRLPEPNVNVSKDTHTVPSTRHGYSENIQTHTDRASLKSRVVNKAWIDRCSIADTEGEEGSMMQTGTIEQGTKPLSAEINFENPLVSEHSNATLESFPNKMQSDSDSFLSKEVVDSASKRLTRSSTLPDPATIEKESTQVTVENSRSNNKFFKTARPVEAVVKNIKRHGEKKKAVKKVGKPIQVKEKTAKTTKSNKASQQKEKRTREKSGPKKARNTTGAIDKMLEEVERVPPQKRKASEVSEFDFIDDQGDSGTKRPKKRIKLMRQKQGNENFVRIDITKKQFVRGRKKVTGIMNKRQNWKLKKRQAAAESKISLLKCKKCGGVGHFAKFCVKDLLNQNTLTEVIDNSPFPTLEEAARMIWSKKATEASMTRTVIFGSGHADTADKEKEIPDAAPAEVAASPITESVGETSVVSNAMDGMDESENEADEHRLVLVSHDDDGTNSVDVSMDVEGNSSQFEQDSINSVPADSQLVVDASMSFGFDTLNCLKQGDGDNSQENSCIQPVFGSNSQSSAVPELEDATILDEALHLFGYNEFRAGQKAAVTRVLRGQSTLVVLSTGSGKSLCYLLPAYVYSKKYPGCLTICVSPLVSLMEDQVQSIPPFLSGACLHTHMSAKQRDLVVEKVKQKELQILLVSPEAICGGLFGLLRNIHEFPPVAFACVDEVHCVSEWSHNFRPSYLRLSQILRERLNVKTILGLTATATNYTIHSVCDHLRIDPNSVIRGEIVPGNLRLSCSRDSDREDALIALLNSKRFETCDSIIVYCTRREQCERIATLIRTMTTGKAHGVIKEGSRRRISTECETYHAGMTSARRKAVQMNFMAGKIRIVVATVAFGMGIDKSDIRAVVHYNMPKTFESYIQEIGRAGRDGLPAECHLFLDSSKGKDICELKRHIYSNSIDRPTLRKLLSRIFRSCTCQRTGKFREILAEEPESKTAQKKQCPGHEISFSVEQTVKDLDLPDENIETFLCYLERYPDRKLINVLPKCYHMCSIQSYGGTNLLKSSARSCAALAAAIAVQKEKKKFKDDDVHFEFNFVEVAKTLGWSSTQMRKELKSLEWTGTQFDAAGNATRFRKSGIIVAFSDLAYRMITLGTLSNEESDAVLNYLHDRNTYQEKMELFQLNRIYESLFSNSCKSREEVLESYIEDKSDSLKNLILQYFNSTDVGLPPAWKPPTVTCDPAKEEMIRQDIRKLIQNHGDLGFSSRAVAKIFQGISSPCFPAEDWARNRAFWRRHVDADFHALCQLAAEEI